MAGFGLLAAGCARKRPPPEQAAPAEVEVVRVKQENVPVYGEWIGTLDGFVNAEIKPQVTGYLLRQDYREGSLVRKGQMLFEIDPRPLQAALDQARATVAQAQGQLAQANSQLAESKAGVLTAEANQGKAQLDVNRYTPLAKERAITVEQLDNAVQANLAAKAEVEAAKARVKTSESAIAAASAAVQAARAAEATASLNLGFTKIQAPIDGIAGIARAQIGNLVSPTSDSLTTVSTVDPIKAYFTVTEQEYLNYVREYPDRQRRQAHTREIQFELVLADGTVYQRKGRFFVADREVNLQTGTIRLAGLFPNPGNILRPGQYGRVRAITDVIPNALLVPQRAVTELQGQYQVAVVDRSNKVNIRTVKVGIRSGAMWVIEEGLRPGEMVVAEGLQRVQQGMIVKPKPFVEQQTPTSRLRG